MAQCTPSAAPGGGRRREGGSQLRYKSRSQAMHTHCPGVLQKRRRAGDAGEAWKGVIQRMDTGRGLVLAE